MNRYLGNRGEADGGGVVPVNETDFQLEPDKVDQNKNPWRVKIM